MTKYVITKFRWQQDPLCDGRPFPARFYDVKRTLSNYRKKRYGKSPTTAMEIQQEMLKPDIFDALGRSLHRDKMVLYNGIHITPEYVNCFFSSKKSVQLILENLDEKDRFFLIDATFRMTPNGLFQQVLIVHIQFGIKVHNIDKTYLTCSDNTNNFRPIPSLTC